MSHTTMLMDAPPEAVYAVLADPPSYDRWVVGTKAIRSYDHTWPEPGSAFHHTVGFGFIAVKDETVSLDSEAGRRLVMLVGAFPFLRATVSFTLEPQDAGTLVTMDEQPKGGPWERFWNPVFDGLTTLRNQASLRRLQRLAKARVGVVHP